MKIGFIGLGNMANAMIGGILAKGLYTKDELIGSSKTEATAFVPGITERPVSRINAFKIALSLRRSILSGSGPMNTNPFLLQARAKCAFSERNP